MPEFIHVNSEDTLKKLNSNKKDKFVKYYMDGCGHCDDLEPIWKLVESRIRKHHDDCNIVIVQLNANFMENADVPNVEGFPTISMIKGGKKIEHKGVRTEEAIMDFFSKNNLLTKQTGGGRRRRKTKKKNKKRKYKTKRTTKRKHKRSKKGKGPVMSRARGLMPAKKVKPQSAVFAEAKESDDNYEVARLNREGNRLLNNIRHPPSPWYDTDAAKLEFDQNKRLYERIMKDAPQAEIVEENPKIVGANTVNNSYYNPKTNDGRNDNFTVVTSRRRRGRNTNRVVPITGGTRKKKIMRKNKKKGRRWSRKYKKSINCRHPKGFSQKQYCKYGRKHKKIMSGGVASGIDMKILMEAAGPVTNNSRVPHTNNINLYDNKGKLIGTTREGINALTALEDAFSGDAGAGITGFSDTITDLYQDGEEEEMTQLLQENGFKDYNDMTDLHHMYSQAKEAARSVEDDVAQLEEEVQEDGPLTEVRINDLINQKYIIRRGDIVYTIV